MSFRVSLSQRAKIEVREILGWINERSRKGAAVWLSMLEENLVQLQNDAASSAAADEAEDFGLDLRQRLFKTRRGNTYRLVFVIREGTVHILAIRGSGQDLLRLGDIQIPE